MYSLSALQATTTISVNSLLVLCTSLILLDRTSKARTVAMFDTVLYGPIVRFPTVAQDYSPKLPYWLLYPPSLGVGVKRLRREGDHSPLSAEIDFSYSSTPPIRLQVVGRDFLSDAF
jgi:hypothetical protein